MSDQVGFASDDLYNTKVLLSVFLVLSFLLTSFFRLVLCRLNYFDIIQHNMLVVLVL